MSRVDYEALFETLVEKADDGDEFSIGIPSLDGENKPAETLVTVRALHVDDDAGVAILRETDLPVEATAVAETYGLDRVLRAELTDGIDDNDDEPPVLELYHKGTFIGNLTTIRAGVVA